MPITVTKNELHRIPTDKGALILGTFLIQLQNPYTVTGETVDLSGYLKKVVDVKLIAEETAPGYQFALNDTGFSSGTFKILALQSALAAHAAAAGGPENCAGAAATMTHAQIVAAITDHAVHAHDLVFQANPAANAVTMAANSLRNASAGALTVVGAGADGGIMNNGAAQAHAAAGGGPIAATVTQPTITHANIAAGVADHAAGAMAECGAIDLSTVRLRCIVWGTP